MFKLASSDVNPKGKVVYEVTTDRSDLKETYLGVRGIHMGGMCNDGVYHKMIFVPIDGVWGTLIRFPKDSLKIVERIK